MLLRFIKTVELPAIGQFKPEDYIKVTPRRERMTAKVVIGYVSNDAKSAMKGRVEPKEAKVRIRNHELCQASADGSILVELGENANLSFNRVFQMMQKQGRGQEGDLSVSDGCANIFFIRDVNKGVLWAAFCYWGSSCGDWGVDADPVTSPGAWGASSQVFSC